MTKEITEQVIESPAVEVVSTSPEAETTPSEVPATSMEDQELAEAQAAIEKAETPEDKERARDGYQRRKAAKELRETQERARTLELELAQEKVRREVYERLGSQRQEPVVPQAPEINVPPVQLPPRPDSSLWTDSDGYEDSDKKMEILADWRADCKLAERDHQRNLEKMQEEQRVLQEKAFNFFNTVVSKYPDFAELTRTGPQPTDNVMAFILNTENSEKVAYYLAKNPQEIGRLNRMQLRDAAISIGRIDARMGISTPQPRTTPSAPAPITPVTPSGPLSSPASEDMPIDDWMAARDKAEFGERT